MTRDTTSGMSNPLRTLPLGVVPGITTGEPVMGPRATKKAMVLFDKTKWGPKASVEILPILDAQAEVLDAQLEQVARVSGEPCGPIEFGAMRGGTLIESYGLFFLHRAMETPENGNLVRTAAALVETGCRMKSNAYKDAVAIARSNPTRRIDPIAAVMHLVKATTEDDTE